MVLSRMAGRQLMLYMKDGASILRDSPEMQSAAIKKITKKVPRENSRNFFL